MRKLDLRLLRMVKKSKGQFASVTVIVAVALCIYIMFKVTVINLQYAVDRYYSETNISDLTVELVRIPQGAVEGLKKIQGIIEAQGRISVDVPLEVEDKDERVRIRLISIPEKGAEINRLYSLESSIELPDEKSVILLEQFAEARNIKKGDIIKPRINGRVYEMSVSGIASSSEFIYLMENEESLMPAPEKSGVAFTGETFAQSIFGYRESYNEVLIKTDPEENIDDIIDAIEKKLDKYGVKKIIKLEDQLSHDVLMQKLDGVEMMSSVLPVMFLSVSAIVISIMLSRLVNNDRIAIGILKALGYGNASVLFHYTKYAFAIGLTGSVTGILGGLLLVKPISKVYIYYFHIPPEKVKIEYSYVFYGILLTSMFCIASGLLGARGVIRILPADSMRPESPKSGKRILIERITFLWKHVPFSWKMVIRNIMRNKKRFAFLVLGLALAYAINTVPLYIGNVMVNMFELQYGKFQKMNYIVEFRNPQNKSVMIDLKNMIDTDEIEPRLEYPFELVNGWRKKTAAIVGVPKDSALHLFEDSKGNVLELPDKGLFVAEAIAKELNIKEGDTLTVKSFIPGKEDVELQVSGIVRQFLGANAYMNIEAMAELLLERQMVTGISVVSGDDLKERLENAGNISAIRSLDDMKRVYVEYLDIMNLAVWLYMLFGGILGFALIYNATIISISERMTEFASLRIMGFDKKDVYSMISKENFIMAGIAIIIGIPFGIAMINGVAESFSSDMMTLPVILTPRSFIQAAAATAFFVIIAQLATLRKIYNLNFIDALKSRIS